ncbi:MAG: hypothetical protein J7604_01850 [Sporocytophaga sp.]|uniref:hypothetical protein n=1 Tax=Sporocytophaga sp. TaxID=2231183 RepID=UPI001B1A30F3|nr:hypothetical protein [Sporocytophaga sp.]MBO9698918.1 hypothetical protein [Sporocytophaga sp.]
MKHFFTTLIILFVLSYNCFSQKTDKEKSEEIKFLKDQSVLNLQFDYQGMLIGDTPEQLYVEEKRETKNSRSEGSGNKWESEWQFNKTDDFPRRFSELFNKYLAKKKLHISKDTSATYTVTVKTLRIDPGFYTGTIASAPAMADMEFIFTKSDEPDKVLCRLRIKGVEGSAGFASFDAGLRMQECYAKAGKILANYILDYAYKK